MRKNTDLRHHKKKAKSRNRPKEKRTRNMILSYQLQKKKKKKRKGKKKIFQVLLDFLTGVDQLLYGLWHSYVTKADRFEMCNVLPFMCTNYEFPMRKCSLPRAILVTFTLHMFKF